MKENDKYLGISISRNGWQPGQVLYEFEPVNDSVSQILIHSLVKDRKIQSGEASIHLNEKMLELHEYAKFVRKSDSGISDKATLYTYKAEYPNGRNTYPIDMHLDDSTFYLRAPSFGNNTANEPVLQHWNEIISHPNLIIDIRNNPGGQDYYYEKLAEIIYSKPYETTGVEWYATKGGIKLFEDDLKSGEITGGEEGIQWTKELISAMKKKIGGFVTHLQNAQSDHTVRQDTVYPMPRNVGIIINQGIASLGEQFLLAAKESDKVILFGNRNTAGVLDYSNITPAPLPSGNYEVWCPITRSKCLPQHPIDNIGIAPDVKIPFPETEQLYDRLDNWVYFVKEYLTILNEKQ